MWRRKQGVLRCAHEGRRSRNVLISAQTDEESGEAAQRQPLLQQSFSHSLCGVSTQDCQLPEVLARESLAILRIRRELWRDGVWIHQRKLMVINTLSLMQGHVPPSFCIDAGSCLGHGEMDEPLIRFSQRCHRCF